MPPPIALPTVTMSGSRPHARVQPPGPALKVCVSSINSSEPAALVRARRPSWKPSSGSTMPMFVSAGSVSTTATSPWASSRSSWSRSLNSATRLVERRVDRRADVARRATRPLRGRDGEGLVDAAVVAVAEHEHLRAPGEVPGEADRPPVGVGGAQREAPPLDAEPPGELVGDEGRLLGREHGRGAAEARQAVVHGADGRRGRVAGHRPGVAEAEVDVLVAVEVRQPGAACAPQVEREAAGPLVHPGHRHPAEQVGGGAGEGGERARVAAHVRGPLPPTKGGEATSVDHWLLRSSTTARGGYLGARACHRCGECGG